MEKIAIRFTETTLPERTVLVPAAFFRDRASMPKDTWRVYAALLARGQNCVTSEDELARALDLDEGLVCDALAYLAERELIAGQPAIDWTRLDYGTAYSLLAV